MKSFRQILVLVETSRAFGRDVLRGVQHFVERHAHEENAIPWRITFEDRGLNDELPVDFDSWQGDGILSRSINKEMYNTLRNKQVPIVELLGDGVNLFPDVCVDERISANMAFEHLRGRGIRNIAFYAYGQSWWTCCRRDSFVGLSKKAGLECYVSPDCQGDNVSTDCYPRWEERYQKSLFEWLQTLPQPVGIWTASDFQAVKVLQACQELDIRVPEQIAVLGVSNDSLMCNLQYPPLSSLDINGEQIGFDAAELLESKIQHFEKTHRLPKPLVNKKNYKPVLVSPIGVVTRQSTDIVSINNADCSEALSYIREHYYKDISAEEVAQHVSLSRSTLDRLFRKLLGRSVEKEIYRLRMDLAEKLLRETDMPVNSVARRTGFDRVEYFVRAFKKFFGAPPQKYRNRSKIR